MSRSSALFKKGDIVQINCYKHGCGGVELLVVLGDERFIHPSFIGAGRFEWKHGTPAHSLDLVRPVNCPVCGTHFDHAIVFLDAKSGKPTAFGYNPKPA